MSKSTNEGRHIGVASPPEKTCTDYACPFHGNLSVRGKILEGTVVNDVTGATVTVERSMLVLDHKYKRYLKKFSKISAHKTPCLDVAKGDKVRIGECRKISKTIAFVVLEKIESEH